MWQFFLHKYNLWYLWQIWALESRHTFDFEPPPINCTVCDLNSGVANKLQYIAATWQKYRLQNRKMYYRESMMTMKENDEMRHCRALLWILTWNMKRKHMHWSSVCFANDKGSRMIYQSKVQMANPIGSSTTCLTEMLIIRKCWQKTVMLIVLESQTNPVDITRLPKSFSQARGGIEQDVLESYCWMYSTWNIPKEYKGACSGGDQVETSQNIPNHPKTSEYTPKHPNTPQNIQEHGKPST